MNSDFAQFLAQYAANSSAPGADRLATHWAAAELVLASANERDSFTWIAWSPDAGLPDQAGSKLGPIERYSWATCSRGTPPRWVIDDPSYNAWYWSDIVQHVLRLRFLFRAKLRILLTGIERGIEECNPLVTALLLRSLFENTATLYALGDLLERRMNRFDVERLAGPRVVDEDLREQLNEFFFGTRFNWADLSRGDVGAWAAEPELTSKSSPRPLPQIMDDIDLVSKNPSYSAFRPTYAWLSEFVHPNVGSHLMFVSSAHLIRDRVVIGFTPSATPEEFALFLEPFTGASCSCLEIVVNTIPQLKSFLQPLDDWCMATLQRYFQQRS